MQGASNTQDLIEIDNIQNDVVFLKNGGMRQIIMVGGMNFALKSEEEQNAITGTFQNFLNGLDFPLQIVVHSRKINIEKYIANLEEFKQKEKSGLLQNQINEYQEFIRSFIGQYAVMKKIFLVTVPFAPLNLPPSAAITGFLPSFLGGGRNKEQQQTKTAEEELATFKEHLQQLRQRVDQVIEGLRTIGLETTLLNNDQLIELFYNFYNPETIEKRGLHTSEPVKQNGQ